MTGFRVVCQSIHQVMFYLENQSKAKPMHYIEGTKIVIRAHKLISGRAQIKIRAIPWLTEKNQEYQGKIEKIRP